MSVALKSQEAGTRSKVMREGQGPQDCGMEVEHETRLALCPKSIIYVQKTHRTDLSEAS